MFELSGSTYMFKTDMPICGIPQTGRSISLGFFFFNQYKTTLRLNPYKSELELSVKTETTAITTQGVVQRNGRPSVRCVGGSCGAVVRTSESGHQVSGNQL